MTLSNSEPLNKSLESIEKDLADSFESFLRQNGEYVSRAAPQLAAQQFILRAQAHFHQEIQSELKKQREDIRSKLPEKKTKDPSNYINEPDLRAWQNGYNKAVGEITKLLGQGD